jgi:hypothetical protein
MNNYRIATKRNQMQFVFNFENLFTGKYVPGYVEENNSPRFDIDELKI